jgi:hypothetical protein
LTEGTVWSVGTVELLCGTVVAVGTVVLPEVVVVEVGTLVLLLPGMPLEGFVPVGV